MSATHHHVSTAAGLYFQQRRAEFDHAAANRALAAMRKGQVLCLQYRSGRPSWGLSGGKSVSAEVAAILLNHALVVPASGALFPDMPARRGGTFND
jgi:hypothetical protein